MKTVHYMNAGYAACGLAGLPSEWPEDHLWAGEWEHVTCQACLGTKKTKPAATTSAILGTDLSKPLPKQKPRAVAEKRKEPCYDDEDRIPFGKHRGEKLMDVPASYLHWLWTQRPITDKHLENYIYNNIEHLRKEHPDGIWT